MSIGLSGYRAQPRQNYLCVSAGNRHLTCNSRIMTGLAVTYTSCELMSETESAISRGTFSKVVWSTNRVNAAVRSVNPSGILPVVQKKLGVCEKLRWWSNVTEFVSKMNRSSRNDAKKHRRISNFWEDLNRSYSTRRVSLNFIHFSQLDFFCVLRTQLLWVAIPFLEVLMSLLKNWNLSTFQRSTIRFDRNITTFSEAIIGRLKDRAVPRPVKRW
jgi:hypothetical protein